MYLYVSFAVSYFVAVKSFSIYRSSTRKWSDRIKPSSLFARLNNKNRNHLFSKITTATEKKHHVHTEPVRWHSQRR